MKHKQKKSSIKKLGFLLRQRLWKGAKHVKGGTRKFFRKTFHLVGQNFIWKALKGNWKQAKKSLLKRFYPYTRSPFWKNLSAKLYVVFRIMVDSLQLKAYPAFKKFLLYMANTLQIFYKSMAEKPEHAWLRPVAGAHMSTVKNSSQIVFYIILSFFVTFFVWANFFAIDEYVHAEGKVEPESELKTLSHLEGGVIQSILVKEGDVVKQNQILLQLNDISPKATYEEGLKEYHLLWAQVLRLKAQINDKPLILPREIEEYSHDIVEETTERYDARMATFHNEQEILVNQLTANISELEEIKKKIESLEKLNALSTERTEMLAKLVEKNLIAKTQFIQSKIDTANRGMELQSAKSSINKLTARVKEGQDKLEQVQLTYNAKDWQELRDQEQRLSEIKKTIAAGKDRVERTDIKSPVNGIVQELFVHTIGSAVTPGKELVSIVPLKDTLLVEVSILPQDIGFIRLGEEARVKVSAFDYTIYGSLGGKVEHISPDTYQDPKDPHRSYYRIHIRTEKNAIEHNGKRHMLIPGQTVQADIVTGQRTVMQYLLKPLTRGLSNPLRER